MLRELSVQNLALIEDVHVELEGGYCAWTGETGAGKSLLLTALGLVLGGKASAELIRTGKTEARAAAVFEVSDPTLRAEVEEVLGDDGLLEDDALIVTRRITAQGRGGATINGLPVTAGDLAPAGRAAGRHPRPAARAAPWWTPTASGPCSTTTAGWETDWKPTAPRSERTSPCGSVVRT